MALKKKATPPTYEQRISSAAAYHAAALSVFEAVIDDLELAARDAGNVADDIDFQIIDLEDEIDRLTALRESAEAAYSGSLNQADKIRTLIGA